MAMKLNKSFVTAILSGALAFGGLGVATAHHGNISEHSTSGGKTLAQIERMERQITADLNRKSAMGPQVALATPAQTPAAPPAPVTEQQPQPPVEQQPTPEPQPIPEQQAPVEQPPAPGDAPAATHPDDRAELNQDQPAEVAAVEEEATEAAN